MTPVRPDNDSTGKPGDWPMLAVFLTVLAGAMWTLSLRWDASILDRYEFRQLQTALSAYWMKQEGFRLDYLTPLFGPPWSIPMEFPTYQWCMATLSTLSGMPLEQAGRLTSILFFVAALPAIYDLLGLAGLAASRRLLALVLIVSSPIYLFYTRAVMIETTALCFSLWFLCSLRRTLESRGWGWLAACTVFALLAALTKVTTFIVYCVPGALLTLVALRESFRGGAPASQPRTGWMLVRAALPVAIAVALTAWWVARGDTIKHSNPYTGFLASTELHQWNYGTLPLRLEPSFWQRIQENITQNQLSEGALAIALVCAALATARARWTALACLAGYFTGPLVFANLYHIHDYYYAANAALLTGAAGLLLASAWDHSRLPAGARWTALAVMLVLQYNAFDRGYHYYYWKAAPPPPDLATIIRDTTPPDGVVLISGDDWNPLLPYYAQRKAVMVAGGRDAEPLVLEAVLAKLSPRPIAAMVLVGGKVRGDQTLIRTRTARLGLAAQPFASSENADLYLPAEAIADAAALLGNRKFNDARVLITPPANLPMPDAREQDLSETDLPFCTPAPSRARSRFGVSLGDIDGQRVLLAHAPSELYLQPPDGATRLTAVVGLAASSYARPLPEASDGVVVEIFELQPNGLRRSLLRRALTPATRESDRGPQELTFDNGSPLRGQVLLSIDPGPAGNPDYDQAYWARIKLH